ncbi:MAG: potassium channel family protein [Acidimicrobiia bacterium]
MNFVAPIIHHRRSFVVLRLTIGLVLFAATLAFETQAIIRSRRPILRAAVALAVLISMFIVVFAWTYLTMCVSSLLAFGQRLDRVSALYFTVTVFSTIGFGDIVAKTDARASLSRRRWSATSSLLGSYFVLPSVQHAVRSTSQNRKQKPPRHLRRTHEVPFPKPGSTDSVS